MEKGAATMKRLFLELGGKSATIVLDDADLDTACLIGIGPSACTPAKAAPSPTRMLLPRSRYDEGVAILKAHLREHAGRRPAGSRHALRPGHLGQAAATASSATSRRASTKAPRCSSASTEAPTEFDKGFCVSPTLFTDVDNSMTIAQEEIFGPVLVVIPYEDDDDAVRIANDSVYGLAGNVMSGSLDRSLAVARRLRAGFIGVNGTAGYGADVPFGGYKESGVGRQNGIAGFSQYTEVKSVAYPADE